MAAVSDTAIAIDAMINARIAPMQEQIDELELKLEACRKVVERWAGGKAKQHIEREYKSLWGLNTRTKKSSRTLL